MANYDDHQEAIGWLKLVMEDEALDYKDRILAAESLARVSDFPQQQPTHQVELANGRYLQAPSYPSDASRQNCFTGNK